jgi:hypothetical protein
MLLDAISCWFLDFKFCSLMRKFRLVNAATGTGKTVAYLAPIIHHLQSYEKRIQRSDGTFGASFLFIIYLQIYKFTFYSASNHFYCL